MMRREDLRDLRSRLSFPAMGPPEPGRVSEAFQKGSLKGLCRVFEGFLKAFRRGPRLTPSKSLQKPFKNPSETPQRPLQRPLLKRFWNPSGVRGSRSSK